MNKRQIRLLNYLYSNHGYYTSELLAENFRVSSRTIKNDIKSLNQVAGVAFQIVAKKSKGYCITVKDEQQLFKLVNTMEANIRENITNYNNEDYLINLAFQLCHEKNFISHQALSGKLFISLPLLSLLLQDLKAAAKAFNLELISSKNKGIKLQGGIYDKRQFISSLYELLTYKQRNFNKESSQINFDFALFYAIREKTVAITESYEYKLYDIKVPRLHCFIYASLKDIAAEQIIDYPCSQVEHISSTEMKIAKEIYETLGFSHNENLFFEYQLLGVYLLSIKEFLEIDLSNLEYSYYLKKLDYLVEQCSSNSRFLSNLFTDMTSKLKFKSVLLHILISANMPEHLNHLLNRDNRMLFDRGPLSDALARSVISTIEKVINKKLASYYIALLSQFFYTDLFVSPSYYNINMLVSSSYGVSYTAKIARQVQRLAGNHVAAVDICNAYAVRYKDLSKYKALILHAQLKFDVSWEIEAVYLYRDISDLVLYQAIDKIYKNIIIKDFLKTIDVIEYCDYSFSSNSNLSRFILEKFAIDDDEFAEFFLSQLNERQVFNDTLYLFLENFRTQSKNYLYLVDVKTKNCPYKKLFCLSYDFTITRNLELAHTVCQLHMEDVSLFIPEKILTWHSLSNTGFKATT